MFDQFKLGSEFFEGLVAADAAIAARVAAEACPWCGGPLHVGNYPRKPRGALAARAGEAFSLRFSLCCGRRGCRHRATPPSLRFLGRRVYLGAVVILASVVALLAATAAAGRGHGGCSAHGAAVGALVARALSKAGLGLAGEVLFTIRKHSPLRCSELIDTMLTGVSWSRTGPVEQIDKAWLTGLIAEPGGPIKNNRENLRLATNNVRARLGLPLPPQPKRGRKSHASAATQDATA